MPLFLAYISSPSSLSSGPESKCEVKFESRIQSLELLQRLAEMTCFIDWAMRPQSYCRWRIKSVSHILTNCRLLPRIILMSNEEVPFLVLYQRTLLETLQNEKSLLFEGALFSPLLKLYPWMLNDRSRRVQGAFKERWLAKKLEWPPDIRVCLILNQSLVCAWMCEVLHMICHKNSESVFLFIVMWNTWNKVQTQAISVAAHKILRPLLHALVNDAKHQKFDLVGQWRWGVQCMKERNFKKYIRVFNNSLLMIWPVLRSYSVPSLAWSSDKLLEVPHQLLFLFNLVIELQIGIVYWYCVNLFEILLPSSSSIAWLKQKTVCIYSIWIL